MGRILSNSNQINNNQNNQWRRYRTLVLPRSTITTTTNTNTNVIGGRISTCTISSWIHCPQLLLPVSLQVLHTLRGGSSSNNHNDNSQHHKRDQEEEDDNGYYNDKEYDDTVGSYQEYYMEEDANMGRSNQYSDISVIPNAILPRAISGMSSGVIFGHHQQQQNQQQQQQHGHNDDHQPHDHDHHHQTCIRNDDDKLTTAPHPPAPPCDRLLPPLPPNPHYNFINNNDDNDYYDDDPLSSSSSSYHEPYVGATTSTTSSTTMTPSSPSLFFLHILEGGGSPGNNNNSYDLAMKSTKIIAFRNRTITALGIGLLLSMISYYFHEDGIIALCIILQAIMYQETTNVIGGHFKNPALKWWWFIASIVSLDATKYFPWKKDLLDVLSYCMVIIGMICTTISFQYTNSTVIEFRDTIRQVAVCILSIVLTIWPSSYWIATIQTYGIPWMFLPAMYVILNDTFAYIGGALFGSHPLVSTISPSKTWEGFFVGGIVPIGVACMLGSTSSSSSSLLPFLSSWYPLTMIDGIVLAVLSSIITPFGGLVASIIKRAYGHKDYGTILPGHGGIVDRLDCQLVMAPIVYYFLLLYKFGTITP
jgi:phosphatidate cytidylyltransferase